MPSSLAGIARFPRARLGHAPTPLDPAPYLGAALGIDLWIKRDDCTGFALGGNKVRQLEFHFGEAEARGADTLLVTGAVQSNLVRIAAAAARRLGMEAHIQLEDRVDGMGALYRTSGNLLLDRVLGATLHSFPEGEDEAAAAAAMERRATALTAKGRRPYVIHSAPGHAPLGGLGYMLAAEEIVDQAPGTGFDAVVCASGSALTHAGILVGLRAFVRRDKLDPTTAESALAIGAHDPAPDSPPRTGSGGKPRLVVNTRSKRAAVVLPAPSRTFDDGGVQERVRLLRPATRESMARAELEASNWLRADEAHWRTLWDHEIGELSTHRESRLAATRLSATGPRSCSSRDSKGNPAQSPTDC